MSKDNGDTIVRQGDKWKRNGLILSILRVLGGSVSFYEIDSNKLSTMLVIDFLVGAELISSVDDAMVKVDLGTEWRIKQCITQEVFKVEGVSTSEVYIDSPVDGYYVFGRKQFLDRFELAEGGSLAGVDNTFNDDTPAQASIAIDGGMGTVNVAVCPSCSYEYPIKSDGSYEISKNGQCYRCQIGRSNAGKMKLNGVAETELLELQMAAVTATRDLGFKQGVDAERERLAGLIKAAKAVRNSLIEYDEDEHGSGEIFYTEMMSESVDLLSEAVKEYEAASKDDS